VTPTTRFDRDTAVELVSPGSYRARIDRGWWAVVGPNGGYLAAVVLRALTDACADPTRSPRSMHLRYLKPAGEGEVEIRTRSLRVGRSVAVLEARVLQQGQEVCVASAAFGGKASAVEYCDAQRPDVPAPEACPVAPKFVPINERFETRPAIGGLPRTSERALGGGWVRPEEPRVVDALLVAALWDAWMPTPLYRRIDVQFGGAAPTVEASLYFRRTLPLHESRPEDYSLVRFESLMAHDGYFEESGEIWSQSGVLLAQSRQLALLY
jgi:acyl-CoA thioesterase